MSDQIKNQARLEKNLESAHRDIERLIGLNKVLSENLTDLCGKYETLSNLEKPKLLQAIPHETSTLSQQVVASPNTEVNQYRDSQFLAGVPAPLNQSPSNITNTSNSIEALQQIPVCNTDTDGSTSNLQQMKDEINQYSKNIATIPLKELRSIKQALEARMLTCKLEMANKKIKKENAIQQKSIESFKGAGLKKELSNFVTEITKDVANVNALNPVQSTPQTIIVVREKDGDWTQVKNRKFPLKSSIQSQSKTPVANKTGKQQK